MTTVRPTAKKPSLLARARTPRKPMLWFEIVLIAVSYWLYSLVRNAVPQEKALALRHADWVWDTERRIGIGVEHAINHAVNKVTWLIVGMNYYYATLHFIVTIGVLVWLYRCHPGRYISGRLALFATTGIALIGFYFFPLAPPRLMEDAGFIDTVAVHHTWGSMSQGSAASVSNPYAAMPSMHIGWSTWCATMIACFARHPWAKALGILYPVATLLVIISTANHFWTDALGGLICLGIGFAFSYAWFGSFPWQLPQYIERRNPDPG